MTAFFEQYLQHITQGLLVIIILFLLYKLLPFYFKKIATKQRFKKGISKEKEAYNVLKKLGFKIIGQNIRYEYDLLVNQLDTKILLEIDYLVKKGKKTYIVEVKTGNSATKIQNSSTRRQILEYSLFVPNDGIFLLDMENEYLQEIEFPGYKQKIKHRNNFFSWLLLITAIVGLGVISILLQP
ncbi:hypothetical protein OAH12_01350 [Cyclobacteriaceae bacterium]|nr:hypothetical protein [Cyclobacteriaceae bacterium]